MKESLLKEPLIIPLKKTMSYNEEIKVDKIGPLFNSQTNSYRNNLTIIDNEPDHRYKHREVRQNSTYCQPHTTSDITKFFFTFDSEEKKYKISESEINIYEKKEYILDRLDKFNRKNIFNIESHYDPTMMQSICIHAPAFIIMIVWMYLSIIFWALFSFNPVWIFIMFIWSKKVYRIWSMTKKIILNKMKIKAIKLILDEENRSKECVENKLKWTLGQSGYWWEAQKIF